MNYRFYILIFLLTSVLVNCTQQSTKQYNANVAVTDMLGRQIEVPDTVERIIGLRAGAVRLLVYMQATNLICGVEDVEKENGRPYQMANPRMADLPIIGPAMGGDPELIAATRPDVIFMTYTSRHDADELQQKTGIPVIALSCGNLREKRDTFYHSLKVIGKVLKKNKRAKALINYIENTIYTLDSLSKRPANEKVKTYIGGVAYSGAHGITSTEPFYTAFQFVNAYNVASVLNDKLISSIKGTTIDIEQLITWNPDFLFIDASGLSLVRKDLTDNSALTATMQALDRNNVFRVLPYNWYAANYETVLVNAYFIGKAIYTEKFRDIEPEEKAKEIYRYFVGRDVSQPMYHTFGRPGKIAFRKL